MQYELSYWEQETFLKDVEVAVIGSGIVGLSAAIQLRKRMPKAKIIVLERGGMPIGASTRNAGFACFGSMTELLDDLDHMPPNEVWGVVERRYRGLENLRSLLGDEAMDYRHWGGYEMFRHEDSAIYESCLDHLDEFNRVAAEFTGQPDTYRLADADLGRFGFKGVQHLLLNSGEGQLHTGKMMMSLLALARQHGVEVINGIQVEGFEESGHHIRIQTGAGWAISAKQVLVCTNGFARQLLPALDVWPARNQVLITKPISKLAFEGCFHYDRGYIYFRNIDGRILLGGARNLDLKNEETDQFGENELIRAALVDLLNTTICPGQKIEVDRWWTGILGLGPIKKPIVERVSARIGVAVRMSGMGVAIGSLVGQEGADMMGEFN